MPLPRPPAYIPSSNADMKAPLEGPEDHPPYNHPVEKRQGLIPMVFQITSPMNRRRALLPHALVLHVNPNSFAESHNKKKEVIQTRGGYVEQHWGDELDEISCDGSTGAFINLVTGLSSVVRQRTIAWDRFRDLYDLYRNNGSVYDPFGNIVLQGLVMLSFDRGCYFGTFRSFSFDESADSPFTFSLSWAFKVEDSFVRYGGGADFNPISPSFQTLNTQQAPPVGVAGEPEAPKPKVPPPPLLNTSGLGSLHGLANRIT